MLEFRKCDDFIEYITTEEDRRMKMKYNTSE
jgi:hypothetical protein